MNTTCNSLIRRAWEPGGVRRTSAPRPAAAVIATCLIGVLSVFWPVGISPASAHGSTANGCTGVPDSGYGFAFHGICDRHDRCYGNKPYGATAAGRKRCDRVFRSAMLGYCERHGTLSGKGLSCRSVANTYYYGVRVLGGPAWRAGASSPIGG